MWQARSKHSTYSVHLLFKPVQLIAQYVKFYFKIKTASNCKKKKKRNSAEIHRIFEQIPDFCKSANPLKFRSVGVVALNAKKSLLAKPEPTIWVSGKGSRHIAPNHITPIAASATSGGGLSSRNICHGKFCSGKILPPLKSQPWTGPNSRGQKLSDLWGCFWLCFHLVFILV